MSNKSSIGRKQEKSDTKIKEDVRDNIFNRYYLPFFISTSLIIMSSILIFLLLFMMGIDDIFFRILIVALHACLFYFFVYRRYIKPFKGNNKALDIFIDLALFLLALSAILLMDGLKEKCHRRETVQTVQDIGEPKPRTYYFVEKFQVLDSMIVDVSDNYQRNRTSRWKREKTHYIELYMASPFIQYANGFDPDVYMYWLCMNFKTDISGEPNNEYINKIKNIFLNETMYKWRNRKTTSDFIYFKVLKPDNKYFTLLWKKISLLNYSYEGKQVKIPESKIILLAPEKEPFSKRGNEPLMWGIVLYLISFFLFHLFIANKTDKDKALFP